MDQSTTAILSDPEMVDPPFQDVFAHWQNLCEGAWAPAWPKFRLDEIELQLLPWSIVVDVEDGGMDFYYRFWGTERVNLIGHEMTGKRASNIPTRICATPTWRSTGRPASTAPRYCATRRC